MPGLERFSRGPPRVSPQHRGASLSTIGPKELFRIREVSSGDDSGYEGDIVAGMPHGRGQYHDPKTGDFYEGEWVQGLYHGNGKLSKSNGITYQGDFVDGMRHGFGVLEWASNPSAFPR